MNVRAVLSRWFTQLGNISLDQGEARVEKHKSQTGCTEGDAQAASQSITRSGGLGAVIVVGRHAFTKRKLILEREKKADRLNGRTRRAKVASVQCEFMEGW